MRIVSQVRLGLALNFLVVLAVALTGWYASHQLLQSSHRVSASHQILENLIRLRLGLKDAETGQRGYLLTGRDGYLNPYESALQRLGELQDETSALTRGNHNHQERLAALKPLIDTKMAELKETVEVRRTQGYDPSLKIVLTDRGKATMDQIEDLLAKMEQEERETLAQSEQRNQDVANQQLEITGAAGMLVLLLLLAGAWMASSINSSMQTSVRDLGEAAQSILTATSQQNQSSRDQAAAVQQIASAITEVATSAEQGARMAERVSKTVLATTQAGQDGTRAVGEVIESVEGIRRQVEATASTIQSLDSRARSIGQIASTVDQVAEQTNLLSVNAAIEAARAGEHGRGFAVVAGEVRALADECKRLTTDVSMVVSESLDLSRSSVRGTEAAYAGVMTVSKVATQAGESIRKLAASLDESARAAGEIGLASVQQAEALRQVQQATGQLDQAARESLRSTEKVEQAASSLQATMARLQKL